MRPDGARQSFGCALKNALSGFAYCAAHERNVQIDLGFAALALILGFAFGVSLPEWLSIVICIGLVMGLEIVNTAIESIVDLASPEFAALAGRAKDCAAGACFVASAAALCVGVVIFAPRILAFVGLSF